MNFQWVASIARTGVLVADLPDLVVPSVKKSLGRYEPAPANLPLPTAPVNWQDATNPGGCVFHLLAENPDDATHGIPIWGGIVVRRSRSHGDVVELDTVTIEGYLDRIFVGDRTYNQVGQNVIIADLITSFIAGDLGIPMRVVFTTPGVGKLRDRTYKDQDDITVYSAISNLMGVIDGPEWNVEWEWQHSPERLTAVLYVGDRVGKTVPDGLGPAATFEMPGPLSGFTFVEDFGAGKGANRVVATSSGQGETRPQSAPMTYPDPTRPRFDFRWSPSSSISEQSTLDDYATKAAAALGPGTNSLTASGDYESAPKLGVDWFLGDDVGYSVGGPAQDGTETVPAFPGGFTGTARAIGWEMTLGNTATIAPILEIPSFES